MRKIKFRGKTEDGRWVYGYLFESQEKIFIMNDAGVNIPVREETVGQLVSDTNNKEVYEGDFVKISYADLYSPKIAAVVYGGMYNIAGFGLTFKGNTDKENGLIWDILNSSNISTLEVIGNIYDNYELWGKTAWEMVDRKDIIILNEDDGEID
jgi:uncharacterized phage protein (TIGR01671 family)